jgi:ParB/RepB/Spo0J family partition protein
MAKKKFLRQTASLKETKKVLEGEPGRDHAAMIVPISIIKVEKNIRKQLDNLDELAESIKKYGILQPLIVAKGFRLIAGHRRLAACKLAGISQVPVRFTKDLAPENEPVLRLIENIQREDLSGLEEIECVASLLPIFEGNKAALAKALNKSRTYVSQACSAYETIKGLDRSMSNALSKSMLFEIGSSVLPDELLKKIESGEVSSVKDLRKDKAGQSERKPSEPLGGGRYVQQAIKYHENEKSGTWSLRINFSPDQTPKASREKIIKRLEEVLAKLRDS